MVAITPGISGARYERPPACRAFALSILFTTKRDSKVTYKSTKVASRRAGAREYSGSQSRLEEAGPPALENVFPVSGF